MRVHDCANLQITDYLSGDRGSWAIAELVPAKTSGYSTVPGAVIRDGRVESSANRSFQLRYESGTLALLTSSTSGPVAAGDYSWIEQSKNEATNSGRAYSPFVNGGVVMYNPGPTQSLLLRFALFFREWTAAWPQGALKAVA